MPLTSLFAPPPKTVKEVARESNRNIKGNQRDLDRELLALNREEVKIVAEIKKLAKLGQNSSAKTMAKELIRIRSQKEKLMTMKSKLSAVGSRTTTMAATTTVAQSMNSATQAMSAMNAAMPAEKLQRTMMEFERQNDMTEMKQEMMDDLLDDEEEEEVDEAMQQVLDSIGLDISEQMSKAKVGTSNPVGKSVEDRELARLLAQMP